MTEQEFAEEVVMEIRIRSMMTYVLSKKGYRKFKLSFMKKANKHLDWDEDKSRKEFDRFCISFNVKLLSNGRLYRQR